MLIACRATPSKISSPVGLLPACAEHANYQLFLSELCDLLAVPPSDPTVPDDDHNAYLFERRVVVLNP